nr:MAG TPA: hypothetical protein [Caudoviricetes sp.]
MFNLFLSPHFLLISSFNILFTFFFIFINKLLL